MAVLDDVRRIAVALPEVVEAPHFDSSSLRVAGRILCTLGADAERIVLKFHPEDQRNLIDDDPETLTPVPGAWGQKGWTHVRIARLDNERLGTLVRLAWATVAPKRLLKAATAA
jgi:hypothetical protein